MVFIDITVWTVSNVFAPHLVSFFLRQHLLLTGCHQNYETLAVAKNQFCCKLLMFFEVLLYF